MFIEPAMNRSRLILGLLLSSLFSLTPVAFSQVRLAPTSLTFTSQLVGSVSAPQAIRLTNSGNTVLTVSSITGSGGYSVKSDCSTVDHGASCTISVSFISGLLGLDRGVITINDDAVSSPQSVTLSGSTFAAPILAPGTLNLGSVPIGMTGQAKEVTLTNRGPAFSVGAIEVSGNYVQSNDCPAMLSSSANCTIKVAFHPTARGTILGSLSVAGADSGGDFPVSARLTGVGVGKVVSHVSLRPANLDFGEIAGIDLVHPVKTVTLTNTSNSTSLTIQKLSVNGPVSLGTPVYQIDSTDCKGLIAPGARCRISLLIGNSVSVPAPVAGALTIVDSDPTSPQIVGLSATELPEVSFSPAILTFAPQKVGTTSAPQIVTVRSNLNSSGISLLPLAVSGDYTLVSAGSNPCGNEPSFDGQGSTCTVGVTFSPNRIGVIHGVVSFTLYPECDPEKVVILHQPCPAAQNVNLAGAGQ